MKETGDKYILENNVFLQIFLYFYDIENRDLKKKNTKKLQCHNQEIKKLLLWLTSPI